MLQCRKKFSVFRKIDVSVSSLSPTVISVKLAVWGGTYQRIREFDELAISVLQNSCMVWHQAINKLVVKS
jgi:hypothetical protein